MKINRITLENFGSYEGITTFETKEQDGRNIILIGGKNGAGKSTLFLNLNGIYEPDEGKVFIDGEELKYDKKSLLKFRQKVGIVFQNPDNQTVASIVEDDIAFGPENIGIKR